MLLKNYPDSYSKYTTKRRKITSTQFAEENSQCAVCKGTHFICEQVMPPKQPYYRSYGYQSKRVAWKIRCANTKCSEPYAVILKPEFWDSAGD